MKRVIEIRVEFEDGDSAPTGEAMVGQITDDLTDVDIIGKVTLISEREE
jgi:hypothetical protein